MTSRQQHVLRLRRTDGQEERLLVNVTRSTTGGSKPLDLKLIAVANRQDPRIYHASFKETKVKSLQTTAFNGDLDQWKTILSYALLHVLPDGPRPDFLKGVEAVSAVKNGKATITLRKNIDGIHQRLGTIDLQEDNEREEVDVFDWVDSAATDSDELRMQLQKLQESTASQQEQLSKLSKQLDDLVKAKKEHEDDLLSKFAALLNTKKLKIRDQQRLLNGAEIDETAAETLMSARASASKGSRRAGASRKGKRKANASADPDEDVLGDATNDDDEDDDDQQEGTDDERLRQDSPETPNGDATDDEDHDTTMADTVNTSNGSTKSRGSYTPERNAHDDGMDIGDAGSSTLPQREKGQEPAQRAEPLPLEDDDDDETDDEL